MKLSTKQDIVLNKINKYAEDICSSGKSDVQLKIAVDQDWVLAKLTEKWIKYYNAIFDDNLSIDDIKDWNITQFVKDEAKPFMLNILNIHKFYRDLEIREDAYDTLKTMSEMPNIELFIVTDPFTRMSFKSKYDWLKEHFDFIPTQNYVFTGNKSIIDADILIDDSKHNCEIFHGLPILFNAPYNKENTDFFKVYNWKEVNDLVNNVFVDLFNFYSKGV